jgi:hypothetical protein
MDSIHDCGPVPTEESEFLKKSFRSGMLHQIGPHVDAVYDLLQSGHRGARIPPSYNLDPWLNRNLVEAILACISSTEA